MDTNTVRRILDRSSTTQNQIHSRVSPHGVNTVSHNIVAYSEYNRKQNEIAERRHDHLGARKRRGCAIR